METDLTKYLALDDEQEKLPKPLPDVEEETEEKEEEAPVASPFDHDYIYIDMNEALHLDQLELEGGWYREW